MDHSAGIPRALLQIRQSSIFKAIRDSSEQDKTENSCYCETYSSPHSSKQDGSEENKYFPLVSQPWSKHRDSHLPALGYVVMRNTAHLSRRARADSAPEQEEGDRCAFWSGLRDFQDRRLLCLVSLSLRYMICEWVYSSTYLLNEMICLKRELETSAHLLIYYH